MRRATGPRHRVAMSMLIVTGRLGPAARSRCWGRTGDHPDPPPAETVTGASPPGARCFAGAGGCSAASGASSCSCSACSPWRSRRRSGAPASSRTRSSEPELRHVGTAAALVTLPGTDPRLAADIAAIQAAGSGRSHREPEHRDRHHPARAAARGKSARHYNAPLLGLVSGSYPAGLGQVALTSQVATLYGAHGGGAWQAAGTTWQVTGIVENPSNLADEFALVAPGQARSPAR